MNDSNKGPVVAGSRDMETGPFLPQEVTVTVIDSVEIRVISTLSKDPAQLAAWSWAWPCWLISLVKWRKLASEWTVLCVLCGVLSR